MAAPAHDKSEMQRDVDHWVNRVSHTAKDHSHITNPTGSASWSSSFFGCFNPVDTCLVTCCCPCITFGKTHHRLNKNGDLVGYSAVNASCLGWWAVSCFGLHCIANLVQRGELRERSQPNLSGNFVTDFLKVCLPSFATCTPDSIGTFPPQHFISRAYIPFIISQPLQKTVS